MVKNLKYFFALSTLQGGFSILWVVFTPSMERNVLWLGLSSSRLAMLLVMLLGCACFLYLTWKSWRDRLWVERIAQQLIQFFQKDTPAVSLITLSGLTTLGLSLMIVLGLTLFKQSGEWYWMPAVLLRSISLLTSLIERGLPLLIWLLFILAQFTAVSLLAVWERISRLKPLFGGFFQMAGYWYLCLPLTALHWVYLVFQIIVFSMLPNWFWKFYNKPLAHPWILIPLGLAGLFFAWLILFSKVQIRLKLLTLVLCGYFLQVGFGWVEGEGYPALLKNFLEKGHYSYTRLASRQPDPWQIVTNYEAASGGDSFVLTKPPGLMLVYIATQKVSGWFAPSSTDQERYLAISQFIVVVFPLIASFTPLVIYASARRLGIVQNQALIPAVSYLFFPNFLLTPFELDQVLYPLLTAGIIYLAIWIWNDPTRTYRFFILGVCLYLVVFLSFSMLPVIVLMACLILLIGICRQKGWLPFGFDLIGLAAGTGISYLIFHWVLRYDALARYLAAAEQHRWHKGFVMTRANILESAYVNNAEWLLWLGAPFVVLITFRLIRSFVYWVRKEAGFLDGLVVSYLVMYLSLNILGQTRTEVARLWLFQVPILALLCGSELISIFRNAIRSVLLVFGLQLLTTFLIFKYQDLD